MTTINAATDDDREISAMLYREFDKPERLKAFGKVCPHLTDKFYWTFFSHIYRANESLYRDQALLRKLILSDRRGKAFLMSDEEYNKFARLPRELTIFRGGWLYNIEGWSWTLNRKKAKWYAIRCPYDGQPLLRKGRIKRERVEAYFGDEGHDEIVVPPERVRVVATLKLPPIELTPSQMLFQQVQAGLMVETEDLRIGMQAVCMRVNIKDNIEKALGHLDERIETLCKWGFTEKAEVLQKLRQLVLEPTPEILALEEAQHVKGEASTA